jgi:hypothetical protein
MRCGYLSSAILVFVLPCHVQCYKTSIAAGGAALGLDQNKTTARCDGAYIIPNYLIESDYSMADAWKLGVPPGARVTVKEVFSPSLKWLEGKTGIVVTTNHQRGHGLVPTYLGADEQVCEFDGKIYFPEFPTKQLGSQSNRPLGKYKEQDVAGMDMGGRVTLSDVSLGPSHLEDCINAGFKVTGPILDGWFKGAVMDEYLEELPVEKLPDIITDKKPLQVIKPPVFLKAIEWMPDSEHLEDVKPIIETLEKGLKMLPSEPAVAIVKAAEYVPDIEMSGKEPLHVVTPGDMQPAQEIVFDAIVRETAKETETVDLSSHEEIRRHCATKNQKIKCCWQNCEHNFVDEVGECLRICKQDSGVKDEGVVGPGEGRRHARRITAADQM